MGHSGLRLREQGVEKRGAQRRGGGSVCCVHSPALGSRANCKSTGDPLPEGLQRQEAGFSAAGRGTHCASLFQSGAEKTRLGTRD